MFINYNGKRINVLMVIEDYEPVSTDVKVSPGKLQIKFTRLDGTNFILEYDNMSNRDAMLQKIDRALDVESVT